MYLETIDKALLAGEFGPAAQRAMRLLQRYGEALGAARFIDIASAHIDGCLYHGPSGLDFVRAFLGTGAQVRVPTTLNVMAIDLVHPERFDAPTALADGQRIEDRNIARVFPSSYVLDRNGIVLFSNFGPVDDWLEYLPFFAHAARHSETPPPETGAQR